MSQQPDDIKPILAIIPANAYEMTGIHYEPPKTSQLVACDLCGEDGWIGITQIQYQQDHPESTVVCATCIAKAKMRGDLPPDVENCFRHLDGPTGKATLYGADLMSDYRYN